MITNFWFGKRVFLTGHTGFKGSWLTVLLTELGAEVHGFALAPTGSPSFYEAARLNDRICTSVIADIRDLSALQRAIKKANPDVVLHLAAQPLVRASYVDPLETYSVNVMGTANLLHSVLGVANLGAVLNITTDKCYENREWSWPYRETDTLGGYDPYSNSKACVELLTASFRNSFFNSAGIGLATARAGNVIGGGDWSLDRLIPDFLRALDCRETLKIRNPLAIRPWQHVIEPLVGYLMLSERLYIEPTKFSKPFNFGPDDSDAKTVKWIVEYLCKKVAGACFTIETSGLHEANFLRLDSSLAKSELGWKPRFNLEEALDLTINWHKVYKTEEDLIAITLNQFHQYCERAEDGTKS